MPNRSQRILARLWLKIWLSVVFVVVATTLLATLGSRFLSEPPIREVVARNAMGTGPFILQEWMPQSHLKAKRNPDYKQYINLYNILTQKGQRTFIMYLMMTHPWEPDGTVERAEEIISTPGLDSIYIGPADLAVSYGLPGRGDWDDGPVRDAILHLRELTQAHGVTLGIYSGKSTYTAALLTDGLVDYVALGIDLVLLNRAFGENINELNIALSK